MRFVAHAQRSVEKSSRLRKKIKKITRKDHLVLFISAGERADPCAGGWGRAS
jgi:hypothetical protein